MSGLLVPVTVTVEVPAGVPAEVLSVSVVDPEPVMVGGLKVAVTPDGKPDAPKLTTPVNPFNGVTVTE